jgi:hypothetical protein
VPPVVPKDPEYTIRLLSLSNLVGPIDRIAADRPHYPGKHRTHGMNVPSLADPFGPLPRASPWLPGAGMRN